MYTVLGLVERETRNVAWRSGTGSWNSAYVNSDLVPGSTVFWFDGFWEEAWDAAEVPPVAVRVDGEEMTPATMW